MEIEMENIVLLGNGINRCSNDYSWDELVKDLIKQYSNGEIIKGEKPFPLLYEQIANSAKENNNQKEDSILKYIADKTELLKANSLHELLLKKYKTILTTNYDYLIESHITKETINPSSTEKRYSLFRMNHIDKYRI